MKTLKSTKGQTILFDDDEILILFGPSITKAQRYFVSIFLIAVAIPGLFMSRSSDSIFSSIAFGLLLLLGLVYFYVHCFLVPKDPEKIKYSELTKFEVISGDHSDSIIMYYDGKKFKLKTKQVDKELIRFLESKIPSVSQK